jgi:hypothetical protein
MPNTYTELATQTLGTAASTVTFSSIPSGYTDLVLQCSLRADTSTFNNMNFPLLRLNGDSTSGLYSVTNLYARNTGGGDTAASQRASNQNEINFGGVATSAMASGIFSTYQIQLQNYANTSVFKTFLARIGTGGNLTAMDGVWASVGLWRNTNAITSLSLTATSSGSFQIGSTFSLYGIANADQGSAKATGGIITEDANYWYHTFGASGTFTPKQALTCDVLMVAGGGGGGSLGAGGGAGGLLNPSGQSLSATPYTVVIGGGGAGSTGYNVSAIQGTSTTFTSLTTAVGGGAGGSYDGAAGSTGGSGGGSPNKAGTAYTGYNGTTGQGEAGGSNPGSGNYFAGAGGGGKSAAGQSVTGTAAGNGGAGLTVYGTTYAGGGGGGNWAAQGAAGVGGSGGGGSGTLSNVGNPGTANTGGGGGGGSFNSPTGGVIYGGGAGGSGIVVVRYAK